MVVCVTTALEASLAVTITVSVCVCVVLETLQSVVGAPAWVIYEVTITVVVAVALEPPPQLLPSSVPMAITAAARMARRRPLRFIVSKLVSCHTSQNPAFLQKSQVSC